MNTKYWLIIKDDNKRKFEVCGQDANDNAFTNKTYAMQKAGMNVSCLTPPITATTPNKDSIKITGYVKEEGLYQKLLDQFTEITIRSIDDW